MKRKHCVAVLMALIVAAMVCGCSAVGGALRADPLPSWNDGTVKKNIFHFVKEVTDSDGTFYVPPDDRIAVFDNDGTLWCEKPLYVPTVFVLHGLSKRAEDHPELRSRQPYKAVWEKDYGYFETLSEQELYQLTVEPFTGMTQTEYVAMAGHFLKKARHQRFKVPYTSLVYQPMVELLSYLASNDFEVFIVSGGMAGLMRAFSREVYDIPPERVIGTSAMFDYTKRDGKAVLIRKDTLVEPICDWDGKAINIQLRIGRRPICAAGNSTGDLEMLEFTADGGAPRLILLVHHDDDEREYKYDAGAEKALDMAKARNWNIVSMKSDFNVMFPFEKPR
ncbi:MAG: haloacid dehalogenase-like hydrolase [Deltaproteobacteria bacterium]|nr:haloacid dehalogenase-like hydrolase [Deltaproteobacteria bacterium]MBN2688180.1 haloacid dehalogenase-like hydrolase [Deltaproteobacteria bacterium]